MLHSKCFLCLCSLCRYIKGTIKLGKSLKLWTNDFYLTCQMLLNHYVKKKQGLGSVPQLQYMLPPAISQKSVTTHVKGKSSICGMARNRGDIRSRRASKTF